MARHPTISKPTASQLRKLRVLYFLTVVVFAFIGLRIFYLQILRYPYYRTLSDDNSLRLIPHRAPRGMITDREGKVLATNVPTYSLFLVPADIRTHAPTLIRLSEILGEPLSSLEGLVASRRQRRKFEPIRIRTSLSPELIARIEENRIHLPGVYLQMEPKRFYPGGDLACHVLGYIGEIGEGELLRLKESGYAVGDLIGKKGIERVYDSWLRGENGGVQVEVNASGVQNRILAVKEPIQGRTLELTLDWELQRLAEDLLGERAGVVAVVDPRNGELLALASRPGFDPNEFVGGISVKKWKKLVQDPLHPLQNRAIQGRYPPGSVYKLVTALSALEEGVEPERALLCRGIFWYKTWPYRCWRTHGHGWVNLGTAIVESCDIFFYQLGLEVKVDSLYRTSRRLGLGSKTRVDLDAEDSGLVPNPKWKESTQHMPWFPGNTIQMSIGQGYLLTTPLQMLDTICAVANGGTVHRPHLLRSVRHERTGRALYETPPEVLFRAEIDPRHLAFLREAMERVVHWGSGTGRRARVPGVRVAAKTGTSENPHGESHAWFTAYAPAGDPRVAVVVLVENGGEGGVVAAPIAKRLLEKALGLEVTPWETPAPTPGLEEMP